MTLLFLFPSFIKGLPETEFIQRQGFTPWLFTSLSPPGSTSAFSLVFPTTDELLHKHIQTLVHTSERRSQSMDSLYVFCLSHTKGSVHSSAPSIALPPCTQSVHVFRDANPLGSHPSRSIFLTATVNFFWATGYKENFWDFHLKSFTWTLRLAHLPIWKAMLD